MFRDWMALRDGEGKEGLFGNLIADEGPFDRSKLLRLAGWGLIAIAALVIAIYLNQSPLSIRRQGLASTADLARETERIQWVSDNAQAESRRLTAATQTLQNDRDRLFARVTNVEQTTAALQSLVTMSASSLEQKPASKPDTGVTESAAPKLADDAQNRPQEKAAQDKSQDKAPDAVTANDAKSEIKPAAKATAAAAPPKASASQPATPNSAQPQASDTPPASTPSQTIAQPAAQSANPPDATVTGSIDKDVAKPTVTLPSSSANVSSDLGESTVEQTTFGIDLGTASSMQALRVLWGTMKKSNGGLLGSLRPIMTVKEGSNGLGLQLHLVAGPLSDAAAATQLCAALAIRNYTCDTAVFDGQRLSMDSVQAEAERAAPFAAKPVKRKREPRRRTVVVRPQAQQQPPQPAPSALARMIGSR